MTSPDIDTHEIWATKLFFARWPEHAAKAQSIIDHLYELQSRETTSIASGLSPAAKSESGLFESRFDLFASHHSELLDLTAFIGQALKSVVSHVNGGTTPPAAIDVYSRESWFHITNDGGYHDAHFHGNCSWCGIFYIQAGDAGNTSADGVARNGVNRFYSPTATGGGYTDFGNEYLRNEYFDVTPEDGRLVLFPSFLLHSALPYSGKQDRIVISFNSQVFQANERGRPH